MVEKILKNSKVEKEYWFCNFNINFSFLKENKVCNYILRAKLVKALYCENKLVASYCT